MIWPSRRGLLAAVGGVAAVAPLPALAASPDAVLLALCGELVEVHASIVESISYPPGTPLEAVWRLEAVTMDLADREANLSQRAASLPAATWAGARAKAVAARASAERDRAGAITPELQPSFVSELAWSALADLARLEGVA